MSADLLLLFPGVSEARFFPYLSLPLLTAYLRARGHEVVQRDLNITLLARLSAVAEPVEDAREPELGPVTAALRSFMAEHGETVRRTAFSRAPSRFPWAVAERLAWTHALRLMDGSVLTRRERRLEALVAQAFEPAAATDLAEATHAALVREELSAHAPRVVGLSVAYFSQLGPALRLAALVREHDPAITVVLGGPQIGIHGPALARCPRIFELVDALVEGAGELALDAILRGEAELPGARTAAGSCPPRPHHLRDNPPPVFDGLPVRAYLNERVQLPVLPTVGCYWGRCVFCSYGNKTAEQGYQQLGPEALAEVCICGMQALDTRWLAFVDENSNLSLLLTTTRLLRERGYELEWSSRNRLERQLADPGFCRELAEAGCRLMSVGYETNSQRLLDRMNKGVDASLYQQIIDNLHEVGIALRFSVMGGLFDETPEEARASRDFLVRNADKIGVDVMQMMIIEPGSLLARNPEAYGLRLASEGEELRANESFSYLGGRVGLSHEFISGGDWELRAAELASFIDAVQPAKNDDRHPRFRKAPPPRPGGVEALRLHDWIVGGRDGRLIDLHRALVLRPSQDWIHDREAHLLSAATERGQLILDRLLHADFGVELGP